MSIVLLLTALQATAIDITKSADDYFHGGAMLYLSNNVPAALTVVTNGLNQYPENEKLQKLEALLKQQQQQSQDQQQQDSQQQDKQQEQEQQQQQEQEQQSKQDQPQEQAEQNDPARQNAGTPEQQQDDRAQDTPAAAGEQQQEMTPEQAMRVLDSTKGDERVLPLLQTQPPAPSNRRVKDW